MRAEREEWMEKESCILTIMAVIQGWEISIPLSFSIDSVMLHTRPGGLLHCFHTSSRARQPNLFSPLILRSLACIHLPTFLSIHHSSSLPLLRSVSSQVPSACVAVASDSHWKVDVNIIRTHISTASPLPDVQLWTTAVFRLVPSC